MFRSAESQLMFGIRLERLTMIDVHDPRKRYPFACAEIQEVVDDGKGRIANICKSRRLLISGSGMYIWCMECIHDTIDRSGYVQV